MKAVIQRVTSACCRVEGKVVGAVEQGFVVMLGVMKTDTEASADAAAKKIAGLRIFTDPAGKMNASLADVNGGVLLISNFTLGADLSKSGRRPSFSDAASPDPAKALYERVADKLREFGVQRVETGEFGADMKIEMVADGPVTLIYDC